MSTSPHSCYASRRAVLACALFSVCSASLLLINKFIMHAAPMASTISTLQFAASTVTAMFVMVQGWAAADAFEWRKVKPYLVYVCMFVTTIYCNFRALEVSNVETLIVARSCVPCAVAMLEVACLGRMLPSPRSWGAMALMIIGAVGYVASDKQFELNGFAAYTWVGLYAVIVSFEMALGKYIVGPHLGFASMWGPVMYTNTLSIPPMVTIGVVTGEPALFCEAAWDAGLVGLVLLSCVVGVAISFLGFQARSLVSATCFTVLGVANKMATVTANVLLWDHHASAAGILCLAVCLLGAAAYQQSPMRADRRDLELLSESEGSHGAVRGTVGAQLADIKLQAATGAPAAAADNEELDANAAMNAEEDGSASARPLGRRAAYDRC